MGSEMCIRDRGFQQNITLSEDALVISLDPGHSRPAGDDQAVKEMTSIRWIPSYDRQIVGTEDDGAQHPEKVTSTLRPRPIDSGSVGPPGVDLHLQQQGSQVIASGKDSGADNGLLGSQSNEGNVVAHSVRGQGGQVLDGLNEVRLALPVGADERRHTWLQCDGRTHVGPEVHQFQLSNIHAFS